MRLVRPAFLITEEAPRNMREKIDILACGSSYRPRLLSPWANGNLRLSSSLTATGSHRNFTGLPDLSARAYVRRD